MNIVWWHLVLYFTVSVTFFLLLLLKFNPRVVRRFIHGLLTDPEFVQETARISQDLLVERIRMEVIPSIVESVSGRIALPDDFHTQVIKSLNLWYGHINKQAQAQENEMAGEMREVGQYLSTNQGNPQAMSSIIQAVSAKRPLLGLAIQALQGSSHSLPSGQNNGPRQGGY